MVLNSVEVCLLKPAKTLLQKLSKICADIEDAQMLRQWQLFCRTITQLQVKISRCIFFGFHLHSILWDPAQFLAHVGADQVISDPSSEDQFGISRSRVSSH